MAIDTLLLLLLLLATQILPNVGLCVCIYDFEEIGDAYIYPSEGAAHYQRRRGGQRGASKVKPFPASLVSHHLFVPPLTVNYASVSRAIVDSFDTWW